MALVNLVEIAVYPYGLFYPTYMIECAIVLNVMFLFSLVHSWLCMYEALDLGRILTHYIEFAMVVDQICRAKLFSTLHYPWIIFSMAAVSTVINLAELISLICISCRHRNYKKLAKETAV